MILLNWFDPISDLLLYKTFNFPLGNDKFTHENFINLETFEWMNRKTSSLCVLSYDSYDMSISCTDIAGVTDEKSFMKSTSSSWIAYIR